MKTWLLDIDGVLNPVGIKPPTHIWDSWTESTVTDLQTGRDWPVKIACDVIDFVNKMHARDEIQIIWHTTWQAGANRISEIFGLPELSVLPAPEFESWNHRRSRGWWKMPAFERFLDTCKHDVLWTDDDLAVIHPAPTHYPGFKLELIAPDQYTGLTPKHLEAIRKFLEEE